MNVISTATALVAKASAARIRLIVTAGALVVGGAIAWGVAHHFEDKGRQLERAVWLQKMADERAADLVLERQHQEAIARLNLMHKQIERKTSENHIKELAQLHRERDADRIAVDRAGGLRVSAAGCARDPAPAAAASASPGGRDEAGAGTIRLPEQVEDGLWRLADDADEVSAQLRACQAWILDHGFYGQMAVDPGVLLDRMLASPNHITQEPHDGRNRSASQD